MRPQTILFVVAVIVAGLFVVVLSPRSADPAGSTPGQALAHNEPHKYLDACAGLYVQAKHIVHAVAQTDIVPADPTILSDGPPPRVQCAIADAYGDIGAVTGDVRCLSLETSCYTVTAVVLPDGTIAYSTVQADTPAHHVKRRRRYRSVSRD